MFLGDNLCPRRILLLVLSVFSCSFFLSYLLPFSTVNALEVGSSYNLNLTVDGSFATIPGDSPAVPSLDGHGGLIYTLPWNRTITRLGFGLGNSPSGTPGLSAHPHLITFTIDYDLAGTVISYYHSPSWTNSVTIFDSCYGAMDTTFMNSFSCTYTLMTSSATSQIITQDGHTIINTTPTASPPAGSYINMFVSPVRVVSLYGGVTSADIESVSQNITDAIEDLEVTVSGSSVTPAQIQSAVVSAIQQSGVNDSIDSIEEGNQQRYEEEKQERDDKEVELNDSVSDLSLSTPAPSNPFTQFFIENPFGSSPSSSRVCVNASQIGDLFNYPNLRVCSPYPTGFWSFFRLINSFFVLGLLIRLYIKHMKGGFNG